MNKRTKESDGSDGEFSCTPCASESLGAAPWVPAWGPWPILQDPREPFSPPGPSPGTHVHVVLQGLRGHHGGLLGEVLAGWVGAVLFQEVL